MTVDQLTAKPDAKKDTDWLALLSDNARTGGQPVRTAVKAPVRSRWQLRVGISVRSAPVLRD